MDELVAPQNSGPVAIAVREARALHHAHVGTEHLLLGLLLEDQGDARRILNEFGLTAERMRGELRRVPSAIEPAPRARLPFTPRVRRALEACAELARRTRASSLRSEHLLLGILEQNDGLARRALLDFDVDIDVVRQRALAVLANAERRSRRPAPQKAEISALDAFGEDWSRSPDPIAAPDPAMETAVIGVLARQRRRAALLLGEDGEGKTTALRRLARSLRGAPLGPRRLIVVQPGGVVAGARHRGRVEERVRVLFAQARSADVALAFDDLDAAMAWPEFLAALELAMRGSTAPIVATTSRRGLARLLDGRAPLLSLFEPIRIGTHDASDRPVGKNVEQTAERAAVLERRIGLLESHHGLRISKATRLAALARAKNGDPVETISLLDAAAAAKRAIALRPTTAIRAAITDAARFEREAERAAVESDDALRADLLERARTARESARRAIAIHAATAIELGPTDLDPTNLKRE